MTKNKQIKLEHAAMLKRLIDIGEILILKNGVPIWESCGKPVHGQEVKNEQDELE